MLAVTAAALLPLLDLPRIPPPAPTAVEAAAHQLLYDLPSLRGGKPGAGFDTDLHYVDGGPLTAQYLLVVDALNFCFWQGVHASRRGAACLEHALML